LKILIKAFSRGSPFFSGLAVKRSTTPSSMVIRAVQHPHCGKAAQPRNAILKSVASGEFYG
jgi:hypothetical protein